MANKIITRFAPSPTGPLHMGNVRTALFSYLFARKNGGNFVLRIEDTDKVRSEEKYTTAVLNALEWLGLKYDNTLVKQSERTEIYKKYLEKMIAEGKAFISKEEATEGKKAEVIRFKNPNIRVKFTDLIRGEIEFDTTELGDFVIAKSLEEPVFHLTVVIDDYEMNVTHVIRGEDHISNTPRHVLIQEAIGAPRPIYAHLPLVLWTDKTKLSKRKHGEFVSIQYYKNLGYLPEAIINFMALIGWNPGGEKELFTLDELIGLFDLSKVQKGGAVFNIEKLNWLNREHLKIRAEKNSAEVKAEVEKFLGREVSEKVFRVILERINYYGEIKDMLANGELAYFFEKPVYDAQKLVWKNDTKEKTVVHYSVILDLLKSIAESDFNADGVKKVLWPYAEKEGKGNVLWPIRFALSGKDKSPDPFTLADIIGKAETLSRIEFAKNALEKL